MIGLKFNNLLVLEKLPDKKYIVFKCLCDCGIVTAAYSFNLKSGHTKSCGCLKSKLIGEAHVTHGNSRVGKRSKVYNIWIAMKQRCYNKNNDWYHRYGGREIKVCERWLNNFEAFLEDMGEPPEGMSIDRIDNNKDYDPWNCKWSNASEQNSNREHFTRDKNLKRRSKTKEEKKNISEGLKKYYVDKYKDLIK